MADVEHEIVVVPQRGAGQDRGTVFRHGRSFVAVIADGAGGTSGGAEAAEALIEHVRLADEVELRWGDASAPDGLPSRAARLTAGLAREWLFVQVIR